MSETFMRSALALVKARLNRLAADTAIDEYLSLRIQSAFSVLKDKGITLDETDNGDLMLLVDLTVFEYHSRDKADGYPMWLTVRIRERWLRDPFRASAGGVGL